MAFSYLSHEEVIAVHAAAIAVGLVAEDKRAALLAGVDAVFVSGLTMVASPGAQTYLDLMTLNGVARLADGSVPLRLWLTNAAALAVGRTEIEVFQGALGRVSARPPPAPSPLPAPSPRRLGRLSGAEFEELMNALLDAFPGAEDLKILLRLRLGKNLAAIAGGSSLQEIVFRLIEVAEAEGWTAKLVEAALAMRPGNEALAGFGAKVGIVIAPA